MSDRSDELAFLWLQQRLEGIGRLSARHPLLSDLTVALVTGVIGVVGLAVQSRLQVEPLIFCFALCGALLLHHRDPLLCFAAVAMIAFVQWLVSVPQPADAALLIALYWVALESELRAVALAAAIVEAGSILATVRWVTSEPLKIWIGLTGLTVAATVLGIMIRQRRALLLSMQEEAARLELERDREGLLAAAAERARIAREMHDIVSHNLTVMIALADGAGYTIQSAPDQAIGAIERVSATGRQALVEMRRLLGVLRDEPSASSFEPQPGLDRLDDLLARVNDAGIPVTIELDGDPRELADGVQLAVFRVAQEALTNTLKHAIRPARAHVTLRCRAGGEVELDITNTASGGSAPNGDGVDGGRGLRGMRERASAYGGDLEAGPTADGGWSVRLRLHPETAGARG